ncbi:hypothetical protein PTKIN_Ptkin05aG0131600 [Pterospermum kingtungense]
MTNPSTVKGSIKDSIKPPSGAFAALDSIHEDDFLEEEGEFSEHVILPVRTRTGLLGGVPIEGKKRNNSVGVKSRQAASESEHVVVSGKEEGKNIVRSIVSNNKEDNMVTNPLFFDDNSSQEHHNDPPLSPILEVHNVNSSDVERDKNQPRGDGMVNRNSS